MTGRYKAYPEYKDSGIEWLKYMPTHWQLTRAKHLFKKVQRPVRPEDGIVTAFRDGEVTLRSNRRVDGFTNAAKEIGYQGVRKGDLIVHAMDGFAGAIGMSDSDGKCSPVCSVCVPWESGVVDTEYYGYLVRQLAVTDFITSLAKGIRERSTEFRFGEFSALPLAVPPYIEQQKIANFLSHETAKIDTLITKQEKLIELLKEKRQAVISHAVTKGLNPDAPMKDSGVEWLEEVPEHWVVCRLKHIKGKDKGSFVDGPFGSNLKSEHFINNGDVYVIESNFATTGSLDISKLKTISTSHFETISRSETKEGAIIIAKIGARYGMSSVLPQLPKRAVVSGNSLSLKVDEEKMDVQYSHQLLSHLKQEGAMDDGVNVTAQPALSLGQLNNLPFLCPPKEEQNDIVSFIQHQNESFSALIESATKMIELSKERKTALISAAVTGKIDVRDWQEPTYQESA
ncbi:restriction endonuclease subunit S [Vibrio parahaemolyticus]|uniref:restriction endonuclease subunit S n=1 Tax=Vibrio TaxID=662 RepID=UPI0003F548BD|nr:restriction endonuclease subunit S [Vibrio parahaemolyticus]EJU8964261.1 restriction endonuclease subunit S [Vibrio parahaemolyticus]TOA25365.1 restriction endonuclease subunit S [Vibrio parahaemolyticus]HDY7968061.1 restriction endonuclease subunit S [Vibrio vulnificus]